VARQKEARVSMEGPLFKPQKRQGKELKMKKEAAYQNRQTNSACLVFYDGTLNEPVFSLCAHRMACWTSSVAFFSLSFSLMCSR